MARSSPPLLAPLAGLLLLSTSILFLFFLILPGSTRSPPFPHTYLLRADTSAIPGARPVSQWLFLYICGPRNLDCSPARPALPFGAAWAPRAPNVPDGLAGSHGNHTTAAHFFFMWRFGWVFILLSLLLELLALVVALGACCGRLGAMAAFAASALAAVFHSVAAGLTTATFVKARDRFHAAGRAANIGPWAFAWLWAGLAGLLLACALFATGMRGGGNPHKEDRNRRSRRRRNKGGPHGAAAGEMEPSLDPDAKRPQDQYT
ncbi:SUR7 family protein FMP45 [Escovopsis weberi]|uniref:SUR7 family protein FMP45 n=1 Tax=Escovopsis weberi TaxID=150374 RepID=A0A0M9VV98_ESCWE|nr:SUR7 family protein FMP45 [Escovopsis weberi]